MPFSEKIGILNVDFRENRHAQRRFYFSQKPFCLMPIFQLLPKTGTILAGLKFVFFFQLLPKIDRKVAGLYFVFYSAQLLTKNRYS